MSIIIVLLIAVSLSMDAFSLSLAYGTLNIEKEKRILISIVVGIYHFIMPLLGMLVGYKIINLLPIKPESAVFFILSIIGIQMIIETFKEEKSISILKFSEILLFGFAVSLDSFSVGIGLNTIYENPLISAIVFSITSLIFTYLGLFFGKKINESIGKISTLLGGIGLIVIGFIYLI